MSELPPYLRPYLLLYVPGEACNGMGEHMKRLDLDEREPCETCNGAGAKLQRVTIEQLRDMLLDHGSMA